MKYYLLYALILADFDMNKMGCLVNKIRTEHNKPPLKINPKLVEAAEKHSKYQSNIRAMQHSGPNGNRFIDRCKETGYRGVPKGENVAYNQKTIDEVLTSWMNSEGFHFLTFRT